tara:strand:+ start:5 stop:472 length:468 start_codon:yes stop_codon:yes gene_type:complete
MPNSNKILYLIRVSQTNFGTFGVLTNHQGHPIILTLENPWKDNIPYDSCIPIGTYTIKRHLSPKFGETFLITDVPSRSHILFHCGNQHTDTYGCVLTGEEFTYFDQPSKPGVVNPGVSESRNGFNKFMTFMDGEDSALLCIRNSTFVEMREDLNG